MHKYTYLCITSICTWHIALFAQKSIHGIELICSYLHLFALFAAFIYSFALLSSVFFSGSLVLSMCVCVCMYCICMSVSRCEVVYGCVWVYVLKSTLNIEEKMRYLSFTEFNVKHWLFVCLSAAARIIHILLDEAFRNCISMKIVLECNVRSSMKRISIRTKGNLYMCMDKWMNWMNEWMNCMNECHKYSVCACVYTYLYGGSSIKTRKTKNPVNIGIKCKHNATETDSKIL